MATSLKTSLEKVLQACNEGSQKRIPSSTRTPPTGVGQYLPEKDHLFTRQHAERIEQGLAAARSGDLARADKLLSLSHSLLYAANLSPEGFLVSKVAYEAASAYLDYQHNNFDTALSRLNEALAIDEQLEKKKQEFALLHLHRIQLLLNGVQLNMRRNHMKEALDMSFHILNYLEGKTKTIPTVVSWDSAQLTLLPQEFIVDLFVGATYRIASIVAGHKTLLVEKQVLDVRDLFTEVQTHIQVGDADSCHLSPEAHAWLRAKQAFLGDDSAEFLAKAEDVLSKGRGDTPFLWYATLLDLFTFCCQSGLPEADMVKDLVANAPTSVWRHLSKTWKQSLSSSRITLFS